ncbi:unnamed protein product, partial [Rotaria sp. Silwood1]
FTALEQIDTSTDIESNYDDETNDVLSIAEYDIADHNEKEQMKQNKMNRINDKNNNNKKLKRRINLESNQIMRYMQDNSSVIVDGRVDLSRKRINRLTSNIAQASATITNLQVQLSTYWTQTTAGAISPITATTSSASANTGRIRDAVDRLEKAILEYIQHSTKRIEYDLPPKFISNANLTFKIDESIISKVEAQIVYDQMRQLTKEYRFQAMSLYLQAITHEKQILKNEIEFVMKDFLQENDEGFDIELDAGYIAFKHYNELREKPKLTEEEHQLLKLGPRFIYNDPKAASRRCTTELAMLKRKIEAQFFKKKSIKSNEVELAHLYYLPKAHKLGTPLRPIISGLKHPTIRISKFLDELLRPLFDKITSNTTVTSGTKVIKQLHEWSKRNIGQETFICTMDVMDLYTMIPQTEVRGGDMGSSLTLTSANCYMFFYERDIVKQVNNSNGLYLRYIDDIFIIINWPIQHLSKQINRWNELDLNIKLKAQVVYHKPSYEPYYLPFNSIHLIHMKMNIPYAMLIRAIKYCSTFETYLNEREKLRMTLLLNKYPGEFLEKQFSRVKRTHGTFIFFDLNDLPDEILMIILKNLYHTEVFYSLINVNQRLNTMVHDPIFTGYLTLMISYSNDLSSRLTDTILNRFWLQILLQIHHKIEFLNLEF